MDAERLASLVKGRGTLKGHMTKIGNFLKRKSNTTRIELQLKQTKAEEYYREFSRVQNAIELIESPSETITEANEIERTNFDNQYYKCMEEIVRRLENLNNSNPPVNNTRSISEIGMSTETPSINNSNSLLPKIQIKPFDGNPLQWRSFKNTFTALVHQAKNIPIAHKFQLLKSSLCGEIASILDSLDGADEEYEVAWDLLKKRCEKPRVITNSHIKAFFELDVVSKDSPVKLRLLRESAEKHVNAMKSLKSDTDTLDAILIFTVTQRLDKTTRRLWDVSLEDDAKPTFNDLMTFINKYEREETVEKTASVQTKSASNVKNITSRAQALVGTHRKLECVLCKEEHNLFSCSQFKAMNTHERSNIVRNNKLCLNCFRDNHTAIKCRGTGCKICNKKHNTLIHFNTTSNSSNVAAKNPNDNKCASVQSSESNNIAEGKNATNEYVTRTHAAISNSEVLLGTAKIKMFDKNNKEHVCRVLLDSCSQTNFITETFAQKLMLAKININSPFAGLGEMQTRANFKINAKIQSNYNKFETFVEFIALPKITGYLPAQLIDKRELQIPKNIQLADSDFNKPAEIDALLGATLYYQLLCNGQIRCSKTDSITLQKTIFGWIVAGEVNTRTHKNQLKCHIITDLDIDLEKFWKLEEIIPQKHLSQEENYCETYFNKTTRRENDGRYTVQLPFNEKRECLGESYEMARKRYQFLEIKLNKNINLKQDYHAFLKEYIDLGHMTDITDDDNHNEGYYIPHHAVVKENNATTKVRVVFDASAKTNMKISLNNILMVGPTVQNDLVSILINFRVHAIALVADIEKMYRQIRIIDTDTVYQKIIWRPNTNENFRIFKLNTVTQGTSLAPFLATRTLNRLADDESQNYPLASQVLKHDFYVGDLLSGANNIETAKKLKVELINLLKSGGFKLHKWASNVSDVIDNEVNVVNETINLDNESRKLLDIQWNPKEDTLNYQVARFEINTQVTKRNILSKIAQLFDPLGLLGPVITYAKLIMQQLWKLELNWDESVPQIINSKWMHFQGQLINLEKFKVYRQMIVRDATEFQLHGFSDASEQAYGACIYLRSQNQKNECTVSLIFAKSRVAPLKQIKLPRLELCGALLLAKAIKYVKEIINLNINEVYLWSDSTIVLNQIKTSPHLLKTFVANRVATIQTITNTHDWNDIATDENPADAISRGQLPTEFLKNKLWLNGPTWLVREKCEWKKLQLSTVCIPDKRSPKTLLCTDTAKDIFERFSSIVKLNRFASLWFRAIDNFRAKTKVYGPLTVNEINNAHLKIIKIIQFNHFSKEIITLKKEKPINSKSELLCLSPFLDSDGIIRVGGRLTNAHLSMSQKYPILLPKHDHVTKLIIRQEHENRWHAGVLSTLNSIRNKYWPLNGKSTTRDIIKTCIQCFKFKPKLASYRMGDLPEGRIQQSRPFDRVGLDYCGPFLIKEKKERNRQKVKAYVAVFVCFVTKAVHFELVTDLTTENCLETIKRFISRRGKPAHLYSDNATNFVGAKNELLKVRQFFLSHETNKNLNDELIKHSITWHFSPPKSPHFGGLWEATVKSLKTHLYRIIKDSLFTYEQFYTCIVQIEAILNSRPLTPLSNDPNDFTALTPFHFLLGDYTHALPEYNYDDVPINRLSQWQQIQRIKQHFWKRWHKEYLNEIRTRSKWHKEDTTHIDVGTLVMIKEDGLLPMQWKLGRITAVHPGVDKIIRVVTVKTKGGELKRNLTKLAPLPIDT